MSFIRALPLARRAAVSAAPRFARAYSAQAAAPSGGAGKTLFVAALAAGAGAAGYHFYAEGQSKSLPSDVLDSLRVQMRRELGTTPTWTPRLRSCLWNT